MVVIRLTENHPYGDISIQENSLFRTPISQFSNLNFSSFVSIWLKKILTNSVAWKFLGPLVVYSTEISHHINIIIPTISL